MNSFTVAFLARQVVGSREAALETVLFLRQVVAKARFTNIDQLVSLLREVGKRLAKAQPKGAFDVALETMRNPHQLSHRAHRWQRRTQSIAQHP